ncbi:peptidoglycan-binding protein [Janthinobacterium sp. BJB412]|nr:peptidoglycan-binding protein [Janthinobacterium sp. BJB412]
MSTPPKSKPAPKPKSAFELWQDTIDDALKNDRWNEYDCDIQRVVGEFNRHLSGQGGFHPLDWRMIKAIIWTESGGPNNRAWQHNPMQIGNPGDPGLRALLSDNEGGELILPPDMRKTLSIDTIKGKPLLNIRAGTAYLLMRLARFRTGTVLDPSDTSEHSVVVRSGDTYTKLAHANGTTIDTLKRLNRGISSLAPGMTLKYQKASVRKIISGWDMVTTSRIALRYNVGDPAYAKKLDYCLSLIKKRVTEAAVCAA